MMITLLQNIFDQLRMQWNIWWGECFPSVAPLPEVKEIPERKVLFEQLEEHRKRHTRDSLARHETIQTITKDLNEAQQTVDQLQQRLTVSHREDWLANALASTEIERLQAMILEKVPLTLSMFIEEIDHELNKLRSTQPTIIHNGSDRNYALMRKTVRFRTNAGSIARRVKALLAARERAIAIKTEPMSVKEIVSEMYRLRQSFSEVVDEETRGALAAMVLS